MKQGSSIALLCLPCGGASAAMYQRWRLRVPRWIEVIPIELPGRGARAGERFSTDFDALVEQLCLEHAPVLERPYALFGHSMGGLLAYGMASLLQLQQRPLPLVMFASASPGPSTDCWRFSGRDDDDALIRDLRHFGGAPEEVFACPEMLRAAIDALGADYGICNSFRYRGPARLPVPLRVLAGRDDEIKLQQLAAWREETLASFALHWFNGGHFYLRPHESALLRLLEKELGSSLRALKENTEAPSPALPV
ncbi:thioesterase [Steroidobacter sp. S1-65]|uniref:Thioesterase n=1 Tax=Steroidobacter gossypii TaxID=2805490 RepID=A0ABS1WXA6_9GAMM|nr:alpha/beta fold hydrolase [Steroidobacter gossypii]MBM0105624.1 thioesterase [Steroidobacter gossypii]